MTPEQYEQIGRVFDAALEHPHGERARFLQNACAGFSWLHAEVEKLLADLERANQASFLELPSPIADRGRSLEPAPLAGVAPHESSIALLPVPSFGAPNPRSAPHYPTFIRDLLRRRFGVAVPVACCLFTGFLVKDLWAGDYLLDQPGMDFWVHAGVVLVTALLSAILWSPLSLDRGLLRLIEVIHLGAVVAFIVQFQIEIYSKSSSWAIKPYEPEVLSSAVDRCSLRWFVLLVGYGVYVPNTWRRGLVVVTSLAACPLLVAVIQGIVECSLFLFTDALLDMTMWMILGSLVAVYSSYKIAVLRQKEFVARKLGHYQLKRLLGKGGMGEVYLAEHMLLHRLCALKVIRPEQAEDARTLRRFEREVRETTKLNHPNIVTIYDYGHADSTFYYVMEYLHGLDLQELVDRHGPLPPARAAHFLKQAAAALHQAHSIGLIHRDIKPSNMIVCALPESADNLKLVDFGLVRIVGAKTGGESVTQENLLAGTPAYMSPEQVTGKANVVDARSDIYSLGAVAYFLLTGSPPFVRETPVEVLAAHLSEQVTPPSQRCCTLPADLEAIVLRCLKKEPGQRFQTAEAVINCLTRCAASSGWTDQQAKAWWLENMPPELPERKESMPGGALGIAIAPEKLG